MTVHSEISWELLNAYVDGELDPAMSAQVAAAAATDPSLAARVATLSHLKASVSAPAHPGRIPPLPAALRSRWPARSRIAAMAAAVMLLLAASILTQRQLSPPSTPIWLDAALAEQQHWIALSSAGKPGDDGLVAISASTAARPLDLSDAQLKLVYAVPVSRMSGQDATFLGYRGPHGCMVGLWIGPPQNDLGASPVALDTGNIGVRAWRDQLRGYALIAGGMDPARIDGLAAAVVRMVDPGQSIDDGIRTALRDVAHTGRACRA